MKWTTIVVFLTPSMGQVLPAGGRQEAGGRSQESPPGQLIHISHNYCSTSMSHAPIMRKSFLPPFFWILDPAPGFPTPHHRPPDLWRRHQVCKLGLCSGGGGAGGAPLLLNQAHRGREGSCSPFLLHLPPTQRSGKAWRDWTISWRQIQHRAVQSSTRPPALCSVVLGHRVLWCEIKCGFIQLLHMKSCKYAPCC